MRERYLYELRELEAELLALGRLADKAVQRAMWALRQSALGEAEAIVRDDDRIDDAAEALTTHAASVIAREGPVAGDLRLLTSFIMCASELERIGDYAEGIARIIVRYGGCPADSLSPKLDQMATDARYMLSSALDALAARDAEISLRLKEYDDRVDTRYTRLFDEAARVMQGDPAMVIPGTYVLWVGHNIERIADRATNIAEYVEYIVRGQISQRKATGEG
jgi:phosphate transport system protein